MDYAKTYGPGLAITAAIAVVSKLAVFMHPSFDPLVVSIIFGMMVSNLLGGKVALERGIDLAISLALPIGIGLYGLQLKFTGGAIPWGVTLCFAAIIFSATFFISRGFGLNKELCFLSATGMSVCGAAAIAVVAPLLRAKKEDISISIVSVMTVGISGMLIFRFLPDLLQISEQRVSLLIGMTLPMFGQVKVAAEMLGPDGVALATNYKLMRVSTLVIAAAGAIAYSGARRRDVSSIWFMLAFFGLAIAGNTIDAAAAWRQALEPIGGFLLTFALGAIGMSLDIESITAKGSAPLMAVFLSWGIVVLGIYLVLSVTG